MRRHPVVVGVDLTPAGIRAATTGWTIAQAGDVPCHMVHAMAEPPSLTRGAPEGTESVDVLERLMESLHVEISEQLRETVPPEALAELEVHVGEPTWVLGRTIDETSAHLLVLGGKHHPAPVRWFGGSTAHNAVRSLEVPVLVAAAPATAFKRILVALDLSEAAVPTLDAAMTFAELFDAEIRVLSVVEPLPSIPDVDVQVDEGEHFRSIEREIRALLANVEQGLSVDTVVQSGSAARMIADQAASWNADLVVVGSHGKGVVDRVLLGSTTERLLNKLPCSILVIPVHEPKAT
jgi:nucleotide-binding universal stress UspA family protein